MTSKLKEIIERASKLFAAKDELQLATVTDYRNEFVSQFESNEEHYLRSGLGYYIEQGEREASEIMKMLIRYNLENPGVTYQLSKII